MTTDSIVQEAINDAQMEADLESLLANKPTFSEAVPIPQGDNRQIEAGSARGLISTAAEIMVWNRETGERSVVIFDAIQARLGKQHFPVDYANPAFAGQRVYTTHPHGCKCGQTTCDPAPMPLRGVLACPLSLSADPAEHAEAAAMGYGVGNRICIKPAYFMTEFDVELHVEKSHHRFWELRERVRERARQQELRTEQQQLRSALEALVKGQQPVMSAPPVPVAVVEAPPKPVAPSNPKPKAALECDCGWVTKPESKNPGASLRAHQRFNCPLRGK